MSIDIADSTSNYWQTLGCLIPFGTAFFAAIFDMALVLFLERIAAHLLGPRDLAGGITASNG